jgi:hypothetical protein
MTQPPVPVRMSVHPERLSEAAEEHLRRVMELVAAKAPAPVLDAAVRVVYDLDPANPRPVTVKAMLDVNGRQVRAHVAARRTDEAADLVELKLRHQMEILREHRLARRHIPSAVAEGTWRHGARPMVRPPYHPRDVEERRLVRRKTYALHRMDRATAAVEMELLDHDFHLYADEATGGDALMERRYDGRLRVTLPRYAEPRVDRDVDGFELVHGAPRTSVDQARRTLADGALRFVFFVDDVTGRGAVVYRRYDGHDGLITAE